MPVIWQKAVKVWVFVLTLVAGACWGQSPPAGDSKSDRPPAASTPSRQSEPPGGYEGFLEMVSCDVLSGWAWAPSQPDSRLTVELYDGDRLLATASADQFRQDLLDGKKGDGGHMFKQTTPVGIRDRRPHSIRAVVKGTSFTLLRLEQAPLSITCEP